MYRLASLNSWYNGQVFTSLRAAVQKARDAHLACPGTQTDVLRDIDKHEYRVVYTKDGVHPCTMIR